MGKKQRVMEMIKAVMMMMMVTSLQIKPKFRAQIKDGDNRLRTTMVTA
jgi:hypothetical protein